MFSGERLRADLRGLQRLCADMRSWAGEEGLLEAKLGVVAAVAVAAVPAKAAKAALVDAELLLAVHERTLTAVGLLLRVLEATPRAQPVARTCPCVARPPLLNAAALVALLWAQVRQLAGPAAGPADGGGEGQGLQGVAGPASPSRGCCSYATQTAASCLRRCEACCVAEAAVKELVEAFCDKLEEPSVAEQKVAVAAALCPSSLSQWGAMRTLTAALCRDLDATLRARGAALAGLELERAAARQALVDAEQALADVEQASRRARKAEERREAAEQRSLAASARVAELEALDGDRLRELARLREAAQAARGREDALLEQLRAAKDALEEAKGRQRRVVDDLEHSRQRAEALQAEHTKLRKQVRLAQERHALLLKYPDFHGPMQPLEHEAGDPVVDMECQVRANEVRVALLTKQNERLRATIAKLRALAASGRPPTRNHSRPTSASSPATATITPPASVAGS